MWNLAYKESEACRVGRNHMGTILHGNYTTWELYCMGTEYQGIRGQRGQYEQTTLYEGTESHNESCFTLQWINEEQNKTKIQVYLQSLGPLLSTPRL